MLIRQERAEGAFASLAEEFNKTPIIDTHEHLPREAARIAKNVSFTELFWHYCIDDFAATGADWDILEKMYGQDTDLAEKWRIFQPLYALTRNGAYQRAGRIAMERFYGVPELNTLEDAALVTERMRERNKPGLYDAVLRQACRVETCMLFTNELPEDPLFKEVWSVEPLTEITSLEALHALKKTVGGVYVRLCDYLEALERHIGELAGRGVRGLKIALAYKRDLDFTPPAFAEAEAIYNRVFTQSVGRKPGPLGYDEIRPLQNLLIDEITRLAGKYGLRMVFHTGIQTGMRNVLDNARPERLWSLFNRHRETVFVLLHAGLPWIRETILLAKYFPNVHVDLAWVHLISPVIAREAIETFVDLAPMNKLLGFGGDYLVVESVYGHLTLARDNIASALAGRVAEGAMTLSDAHAWQKAMLYDNPKAVYRL